MKTTAALLMLLIILSLFPVASGCSPAIPAAPAQPSPAPIPAQVSPSPSTPAPVISEAELKYDNDSPYINLVMSAGGFLVNFDAPSTSFTIKKVKLFGSRGSSIHEFQMEIWDKERTAVFKQAYSDAAFPEIKKSSSGYDLSAGGKWVELTVPDITVSGKFYVHVWSRLGGISIGGDNSSTNEHSGITRLDAGKVAIQEVATWSKADFCKCWTVMSWEQSKTNWMIRVDGTYPVSKK